MDATAITARRAALTARLVAAEPVRITVRRGTVESGPFTVAVSKMGAGRLARGNSGEASSETRGYVTFAGDVTLDIRRNDRVRTPDGQVYFVMLVAPNRNGRITVECVAEQ